MAAVADWTFEGTWPYEPRWFDSPDGRMHYVDEGPRDGRPGGHGPRQPHLGLPVPELHPAPGRGRGPGGELLVKGLDAFKRGFLFGQGVAHRERLTPTIKRAYRAVHSGWSERTPILVFPREIPVTGEGPVVAMTSEIEEALKRDFRSKRVHITWAMKDPAFLPSYLDTLWLDTFPDATVTKLEDAGHYLQEDAHERIVPELVSFAGAQH
ncbi:MAG: hypothetical protein ACRDKX_03035 [Solirubrobacterales bacterium]